jgi:CheY-like chemotaxis protein
MVESHAAVDGASDASGASAAGTGRRVLVVDDNRDAADSLAMLLSLEGHEVKTVHSGEVALQVGPSYAPEVVLLDIGMPGMNGYEVARRIRAKPWKKSLMLVAVTGWGQAEDKRRALEAGFDDHMTKPVDPAMLSLLLATSKT